MIIIYMRIYMRLYKYKFFNKLLIVVHLNDLLHE